MVNLRLRGVPRPPDSAAHEVPSGPRAPVTLRGNSERGKEEVWETSASFPLLFLSHSFLHSHAFRLFFFFFCVFFARITFFHIYTWLPAVLFASPRSLCCCCPPRRRRRPVPPCLRSFDQACVSPSLSLLQNSVSLPFPISCPPAPLLPVPLLLKWQRSMICWPSPGRAPGRERLVPRRCVV